MVANTVPESGLLLFLGFNVLWTALKDILWFNVDFGDCYGLDDPLWGSVWRYVVKTISQTDVNCWTSLPTIYQLSPFLLKFKHVVETRQVLICEGAANLLVLVITLDTIRMWRTISFLRNAWFFYSVSTSCFYFIFSEVSGLHHPCFFPHKWFFKRVRYDVSFSIMVRAFKKNVT